MSYELGDVQSGQSFSREIGRVLVSISCVWTDGPLRSNRSTELQAASHMPMESGSMKG